MKGDFEMNDNTGHKVLRELELDQKLDSEPQQAMREFVKALPADELSMAWRSGLNQKLLATAVRQRRQRILGWVLKPAAGLAVAGALAFAVVMRQPAGPSMPTSSNRDSALEASIVSTHRDSNAYSDLVGAGLLPVEVVNDKTEGSPVRSDWSEVDVDTL